MITLMFKADTNDIIEKTCSLLLFIIFFLIKDIYSIVYYFGYSGIAILAVLHIFHPFESYLVGSFKTVLYLIITAILISFVLIVINDQIALTINSDGFISGIEGVVKLLSLGFLLFGTLGISQMFVSGRGAEAWAGSMGKYLGAGIGLKALSLPFSMAAQTASMGANAISSVAGGALGKVGNAGFKVAKGTAKTASYIASRPLAMGANALKSSLSDKSSAILKEKGMNLIESKNDRSPTAYGTYERNFAQSLGGNSTSKIPLKSIANPINHLKATAGSMADTKNSLTQKTQNYLGLPKTERPLSLKEKSIVMADKALNRPSASINKEQIKQNNLKAMDRINDRTNKK